MTMSLGNPFTLGATGVLTTARTDRITLGAMFRPAAPANPAAPALGAISGILMGPTGTVGGVILVSDTLLRVDPFVAVINGTHNTTQGQYEVPNVAQRDLAVPAKDASQFRRAYLAVRVADSLEAGVASSATTDGAWLDIITGALADSAPALPATPPNTLLLGELTIPSVASGQPVTWTGYAPRTTMRGGILPVYNDTSTVPGHGAAPGTHLGEYRDHPTHGLQRWDGTAWLMVGAGRYHVFTYRLTDSSPTFSGGYYPWGFDAKIDPYNMYDIPTNYFSAPVKGIYAVQGNAFFAGGAAGGQDRGSRWERTVWAGNVVTIVPGSRAFTTLANAGYVGNIIGPTALVQLDAGDGLQFKTYHTASTNIVLRGDNTAGGLIGSTSASMTLLRQLP